MGSAAKCQICGDTIYYAPDQVSVLAEHFCYDHPEQEVGYFSIVPSYPVHTSRSFEVTEQEIKVTSKTSNTVRKKNKGFQMTGCPGGSHGSVCSHCSGCDYNFRRERNFKTTVETWSQGPNHLSCPACGKSGPPLIRRQRNKIANSSLGALCLLGCWPLCFLPFMLGGSNVMNLYCKNCGTFLATYDRHLGQIKREKMEVVNIPNLCS